MARRASGGGKKAAAGGKRESKKQAALTAGDGRPLTNGDNVKNGTAESDAERASFLSWHCKWELHREKEKELKAARREIVAGLKNAGHTIHQMRIAEDLADSAEKEQKVHREVQDRLRVSRFLGLPLGSQLQMFDHPDRTPSVDHARDGGKMQAMRNEALRPPHAPETPQHRAWCEGYHDEQGRQVKEGIKPLEDTERASEARDRGEAGAAEEEIAGAMDEEPPQEGWGDTMMPPAAQAESDL